MLGYVLHDAACSSHQSWILRRHDLVMYPLFLQIRVGGVSLFARVHPQNFGNAGTLQVKEVMRETKQS